MAAPHTQPASAETGQQPVQDSCCSKPAIGSEPTVKSCCGKAEPLPEPPPGDCCGTGNNANEAEPSWLPVGLAAVVAGQSMVFGLAVNLTPPAFGSPAYLILHGWLLLSALLVLALLLGEPLRGVLEAARRRRLSVESLFVLTALGALAGSVVSTFTGAGDVYYEVVAIVLVIYAVGRRVGDHSRQKVLAEARLLRARFESAQVILEDGSTRERPVADVERGTRVRVAPGEAIPVDGRIIRGEAYVDERLVRGELLPRIRRTGDAVWAGALSVDGWLELETLAAGGERHLDAVLTSLDRAGSVPSRWESQADRITQFFLPVVAGVALLTGLGWAWVAAWPVAVFNSMAVLLVACPCALGLATPIGVWTGLWRLAEQGLVSREARLLDALAETRHLFFDKTGTLSGPSLELADWLVTDPDQREVRRAVMLEAERRLQHPVAAALAAGLAQPDPAGEPAPGWQLESVRSIAGRGIEVTGRTADGSPETIRIGAGSWVHPAARSALDALAQPAEERLGQRCQRIYAATERGEPWAVFLLKETARPNLKGLISRLTAEGVRVSILSGDPDPAWRTVDGVTVEGNLSPAEKADRVRSARKAGERPLVIGDGINDLAAMEQASAGIALGDGMDTVQVAATAVAGADRLHRLPAWLATARQVRGRLIGNLWFAVAYNGIGMTLAAAGLLHPVVAVLLMAVSSLLVSVRSGRLPAER
ncbi:MAG: heavy metal translocating P-type ATPase [Opitutales bacterium]